MWSFCTSLADSLLMTGCRQVTRAKARSERTVSDSLALTVHLSLLRSSLHHYSSTTTRPAVLRQLSIHLSRVSQRPFNMPTDSKDNKRSLYDRMKLPSPGTRTTRSNSSAQGSSRGSSTSSPSSSSSRGRGGAGTGRGRGGAPARVGGAATAWQARRENYATIARENEDTLIPQLLKQAPSLAAAVEKTESYDSPPQQTEIKPLEEGKQTRFSLVNQDSYDAAEELVLKWGSNKVAVLNMCVVLHPERAHR